MAKVTVVNGATFEVDNDTRLVLALEDHGIDVLHRCGGYARCTTCRVVFHSGEPEDMTLAEYEKLSERELIGQFRLSCQILCEHEMTVEPVMTLRGSGLSDAGPRPEDDLTPDPEWIDVDKPEV